MVPYDYDRTDAVFIGFIPSEMRVDIDFDMTNGIEAIEGKSKWSEVEMQDRLDFALALTDYIEKWEPEGKPRGQRDYMLLYTGNLIDQAERAVLPIMDEVVTRPDYEAMLERYPFLGSFGSPFGGHTFQPEATVPTRQEADLIWAKGVSRG